MLDLPARIAGEVYPRNPERAVDVADYLDLLEKQAKVITRYSVNGDNFIVVNNFKAYQRIHKDEVKSHLPEPPDHLTRIQHESCENPARIQHESCAPPTSKAEAEAEAEAACAASPPPLIDVDVQSLLTQAAHEIAPSLNCPDKKIIGRVANSIGKNEPGLIWLAGFLKKKMRVNGSPPKTWGWFADVVEAEAAQARKRGEL
jgi:hypothetical protein